MLRVIAWVSCSGFAVNTFVRVTKPIVALLAMCEANMYRRLEVGSNHQSPLSGCCNQLYQPRQQICTFVVYARMMIMYQLTQISHSVGIAILITLEPLFATAEEKIIQKEKISFEKCMKVITTSENKLSIAPKSNRCIT